MKHRLPRAIKIIVLLLFIGIILFLSQYFKPHFVFLGIFFLEAAEAALVYSLIIIATLLLIYFTIKRHRKTYLPLLALYCFIGINTFINLVASVFFSEDLRGFIDRIFGSYGFFGAFVLNQIVLLFLCLLIVLYAWSNRQIFDRR